MDCIVYLPFSSGFQFTRPRGRDRHRLSVQPCACVSIHAPTGARLNFAMASVPADTFQFTRPRGRDLSALTKDYAAAGFNSRAHGGATKIPQRAGGARAVSIHAPTGARLADDAGLADALQFQFTRPRGRDAVYLAIACGVRAFQFTRPRGRDLCRGRWRMTLGVSIHAPTGARHPLPIPAQRAQTFQFTRPRGRDMV